MIRFCDKEVNCIMVNELNRSVLFSYFLNGHRDEIICVLDETGAYYGIINYNLLLKNQDIHDAISRAHVIIGENMWQEARTYFFYYEKVFGEIPLLPVVDRGGNLLCFAYEDEYANRQMRMLRELTENEELLQFYDIYPEYDCVTIHECNELAWYFAKYLQKIGVPVRVEGIMWSFFDEWETFDCLEYRNYTIYAEDTWQKNPNLAEYLLRSVSVCFECIDKIYEENIYAGKIVNADGDFNTMLQKLQNKDVFILGIDNEAQDVYDILLGNGIEAKGFIKELRKGNQKYLLNKPVYRLREVTSNYENAVFIETREKSSAWGLGLTDNYDYYNFTRNERFFLIEDYIKVEPTMLQNTLKGKAVVLVGEADLCECVYEYLREKQPEIVSIHYYNLIKGKQNHNMPELMVEDIKPDVIYLSVLLKYWDEIYEEGYITYNETRKNTVRCYTENLEKREEITEYFSSDAVLVEIEKEKGQCMKKELIPASIVVGALNSYSGCVLMHGILDSHPELISLEYGFLNKELLRICIKLSRKKATEIPEHFWYVYDALDTEAQEIKKEEREAFEKELVKLLSVGEYFSSQELFVIIHIAYAKLRGQKIDDVRQLHIYWEPHRGALETMKLAEWLEKVSVKCTILRMFRNQYMRNGSAMRITDKVEARNVFLTVPFTVPYTFDEKIPVGWKRIDLKFEDVKCKPNEVLLKLCREIGISWSDTLLETTSYGKEESFHGVTGFNLKPVYNLYEEYFSAFDRMRISIIAMTVQKAFGYPYLDCRDFSKAELQEMFVKDFRFEKSVVFKDEEDRLRAKKFRLNMIYTQLQKNRRDAFILEKE